MDCPQCGLHLEVGSEVTEDDELTCTGCQATLSPLHRRGRGWPLRGLRGCVAMYPRHPRPRSVPSVCAWLGRMILPLANYPADALLDERSDPDVRDVIDDWAIENEVVITRFGMALFTVGGGVLEPGQYPCEVVLISYTDNDACSDPDADHCDVDRETESSDVEISQYEVACIFAADVDVNGDAIGMWMRIREELRFMCEFLREEPE